MRHLLRTAALIESWFDFMPQGQQATARELQAALLAAAPHLHQSVKSGNLVFALDNRHAFALMMHKGHAHFQVYRGAQLAARFPQLEGSGKGLRHLSFRYGQPVDGGLVADLAQAALALMAEPEGDPREG